jgi:hypothetical protein
MGAFPLDPSSCPTLFRVGGSSPSARTPQLYTRKNGPARGEHNPDKAEVKGRPATAAAPQRGDRPAGDGKNRGELKNLTRQ